MGLLTKRVVTQSAHKKGERGTVIFSVVLAILLLGGIGLWAMRFTALSDRASGYSRLALQAQYLSELGVQTSTAYLALPGYAQANYQIGDNNPDSCLSVKATTLDSAPFCRAITLSELNTTTNASASSNVIDTAAQGSLGPFAAASGGIRGDFIVEISEPRQTIVAGDDVSSPLYRQVTLTSYAILRPDDPASADDSATVCLETTAAAATRMGMRAVSIVGPIY